jgi:hypothetical protein
MHSSLLVCLARVGLDVVLMVLGLGFGGGPEAEAGWVCWPRSTR